MDVNGERATETEFIRAGLLLADAPWVGPSGLERVQSRDERRPADPRIYLDQSERWLQPVDAAVFAQVD